MKVFFKMLVASILGCFLVLFAGVLFFFGLLALLISVGDSPTKNVPNQAILQISFEKPVLEQGSVNPLSKAIPFGLYQDDGEGYYDLVSAIDRAAQDDRIQMIYINTNHLNASISHLFEIREALKRFRASGKAVIAYSDSYSQGGYYLSSVADKVYLSPHGEITLRGFALSVHYYKGLMDELGVEAQLVRHGKFKSGGEPFTMIRMSPEERRQLDLYIQSVWESWANDISADRQIDLQTVNSMAERVVTVNSLEAKEYKLIDDLFYKDELIEHLCKLQNVKNEKNLRVIDMLSYLSHKPLNKAKEKIAILFAHGTLYVGKGDQDIMSDNYIRTLRKLRADSSVKAVVLRINSQGGDARAAAIIHRELQLLSEVKPLIVSLGDQAASGGYWISCPGRYIFSTPSTLTGSIGAYSILWNGQQGISKWLKVNVETIRTHPSSDMGSIYRPINNHELALLQKGVDHTYNIFVSTVSQGRGIQIEDIEKVAQGQIWGGEEALKKGLVDQIGGLYDAICFTAQSTGLSEYQVVEYPFVTSFWARLKNSVQTKNRLSALNSDPHKWVEEIEKVLSKEASLGIQAKIPFMFSLFY